VTAIMTSAAWLRHFQFGTFEVSSASFTS